MPANDSGSELQTLDEVTVIARKREENIQDVPAMITALGSEDLEQRVVLRTQDLQDNVPTLRVVAAPGQGQDFPQYSLRGLRSNGVVLYLGEVPVNSAEVDRALYDISSVQVLTGPQGTLFGKNTTAGAILFQPARPTDRLEGYASLSVGDYDMYDAQGMINLPVSPTLMIRLAGESMQRDGFTTIVQSAEPGLRNPGGDTHNGQRLSILFEPTDRIKIDTVVDRLYSDNLPSANKLIAYTPCPASPSPAQFGFVDCVYRPPVTTLTGLPTWQSQAAREASLGPFETANTFQGRSNLSDFGVTNTAEFDLSTTWTLKNIFGYRRFTNERFISTSGTSLPATVPDFYTDYHNTSDELQLQFAGLRDRLHWLLGGFYSDDKEADRESVAVDSINIDTPTYLTQATTETQNYAAFTQGTLAITKQLNLTAGYRYSNESQQVANIEIYAPTSSCTYVPPNPLVDFSNCQFSDGEHETASSYVFSLDYSPMKDVLLYATHRRSFNAGGFNTLTSSPDFATFKPETVSDVEIGAKTETRMGSVPVRANVALYRSKYSDIQRDVQRFDGNVPAFLIVNAAAAVVEGADLQLDAEILKGSALGHFNIDGYVSYLHAKYDSFGIETSPGSFADVSSNALALAPRLTSNLGLTYHLPIPTTLVGDASTRVAWVYTAGYYFSDINEVNFLASNTMDPYNHQPGYSLLDLELNFSKVFGTQVDAKFFMKNVTNKAYAIAMNNSLSTLGYATSEYGDPRTFGFTLSYRFKQ